MSNYFETTFEFEKKQMKYDLKVINFFGPPGTGKSTVASGLFNLMKVNGFSVEAINEFAKQMYWERRHPDHFQNQCVS